MSKHPAPGRSVISRALTATATHGEFRMVLFLHQPRAILPQMQVVPAGKRSKPIIENSTWLVANGADGKAQRRLP